MTTEYTKCCHPLPFNRSHTLSPIQSRGGGREEEEEYSLKVEGTYFTLSTLLTYQQLCNTRPKYIRSMRRIRGSRGQVMKIRAAIDPPFKNFNSKNKWRAFLLKALSGCDCLFLEGKKSFRGGIDRLQAACEGERPVGGGGGSRTKETRTRAR